MNSVVEWVKRYQRKRIVKSCMRKMWVQLRQDYGLQESYTRKQVMATMTRARLSKSEEDFAEMFVDVREYTDEEIPYPIRQIVADVCFEGNDNFTLVDVADYICTTMTTAGEGGFGDASGGDSD